MLRECPTELELSWFVRNAAEVERQPFRRTLIRLLGILISLCTPFLRNFKSLRRPFTGIGSCFVASARRCSALFGVQNPRRRAPMRI
jgi:hypothetical protein